MTAWNIQLAGTPPFGPSNWKPKEQLSESLTVSNGLSLATAKKYWHITSSWSIISRKTHQITEYLTRQLLAENSSWVWSRWLMPGPDTRPVLNTLSWAKVQQPKNQQSNSACESEMQTFIQILCATSFGFFVQPVYACCWFLQWRDTVSKH